MIETYTDAQRMLVRLSQATNGTTKPFEFNVLNGNDLAGLVMKIDELSEAGFITSSPSTNPFGVLCALTDAGAAEAKRLARS